ncbi:beta-fructofuranosidase, insoluble isoenzyme 3-like [Miscanthus floridulus]|uniref:beta-fructofuranosidase, insoluble isoenzyme 3-like n=1 Tax=Miscanthus floridulus TaxID=154761 RepID=UPI00345860B9
MYYKGVYHLFYQYNPKGAVWGNIVWAHAVSTDLVDWVMLPPAIYPTAPFDVNGCWSGSATVLPDGTPVIMYTGIDGENRQVQNVAYPKDLSDPYLREWVKPDYNPVIAPAPGMNATAFRDPTTAWQGPDGLWRLVIGTKDNHRGLAMLYRSRDFKRWAPARRALHSGDTGMWECPDFYPVNSPGIGGGGGGTKHVLKVSLDLTRFEYYTFGEYDNATDTYVPDAALADGNDGLRYDYGNFYASKTFLDTAKQRRILWGWANESDSTADDVRKGWAGVQAVPRKVWLAPDGKQLVQWPVAEIESLRGNHVNVTDTLLKAGQHFEVSGLGSPAQADVEASFQVMDLDKAEPFDPAWRAADAQTVCAARGAEAKGGVGPFGLWVLASDDLKERTAVFFRVFKGGGDGGKHVVLMCNDPSMSSHADNLYKPTFAGFVDVDVAQTGGKIPLRTLIDHSVVESFGANGKTCILSRMYPTKAIGDKARLYLFNNGESDVKVTHLNAYEMRSAKITADVKQNT